MFQSPITEFNRIDSDTESVSDDGDIDDRICEEKVEYCICKAFKYDPEGSYLCDGCYFPIHLDCSGNKEFIRALWMKKPLPNKSFYCFICKKNETLIELYRNEILSSKRAKLLSDETIKSSTTNMDTFEDRTSTPPLTPDSITPPLIKPNSPVSITENDLKIDKSITKSSPRESSLSDDDLFVLDAEASFAECIDSLEIPHSNDSMPDTKRKQNKKSGTQLKRASKPTSVKRVYKTNNLNKNSKLAL